MPAATAPYAWHCASFWRHQQPLPARATAGSSTALLHRWKLRVAGRALYLNPLIWLTCRCCARQRDPRLPSAAPQGQQAAAAALAAAAAVLRGAQAQFAATQPPVLQPSVPDLRPPPEIALPPPPPDRLPAAAGEESAEAAVQAARERRTVGRPSQRTWPLMCLGMLLVLRLLRSSLRSRAAVCEPRD